MQLASCSRYGITGSETRVLHMHRRGYVLQKINSSSISLLALDVDSSRSETLCSWPSAVSVSLIATYYAAEHCQDFLLVRVRDSEQHALHALDLRGKLLGVETHFHCNSILRCVNVATRTCLVDVRDSSPHCELSTFMCPWDSRSCPCIWATMQAEAWLPYGTGFAAFEEEDRESPQDRCAIFLLMGPGLLIRYCISRGMLLMALVVCSARTARPREPRQVARAQKDSAVRAYVQ